MLLEQRADAIEGVVLTQRLDAMVCSLFLSLSLTHTHTLSLSLACLLALSLALALSLFLIISRPPSHSRG